MIAQPRKRSEEALIATSEENINDLAHSRVNFAPNARSCGNEEVMPSIPKSRVAMQLNHDGQRGGHDSAPHTQLTSMNQRYTAPPFRVLEKKPTGPKTVEKRKRTSNSITEHSRGQRLMHPIIGSFCTPWIFTTSSSILIFFQGLLDLYHVFKIPAHSYRYGTEPFGRRGPRSLHIYIEMGRMKKRQRKIQPCKTQKGKGLISMRLGICGIHTTKTESLSVVSTGKIASSRTFC